MEAKKILKKLDQHPLVKKMIADEEDELSSLRKKALAEIATFENFKEDAIKTHEAELKEVEKAIVQEQARLQISLRRRGKLNHEHHVKIVDYDNTIRRLKGLLLSNYEPRIDVFISAMIKRHMVILNSGKIIETKGKMNPYTDLAPKYVHSNKVKIEKASKYILEALDEANKMKSMAISSMDVKQRLDKLWENVPDNDFDILCNFEIPVPDVTELKRPVPPGHRSSWINSPIG